MDTYHLTDEQRFELVMECRTSGLPDYQWCREHDIKPSTFYNWISRFRKKGYPNIPEPMRRESKHKTISQEVVKLELPADESCDFILPGKLNLDQNDPMPDFHSPQIDPVIEICINGTLIRMTNHVSPRILGTVLSQIGGLR